ncbi:MAG: hypothetical protein DLM68_14650 [Hyphomicrobiales bacterium]|nr:MAG: hypothetical protein DLM68_14650 [Hyphomicrobiales bacterium]
MKWTPSAGPSRRFLSWKIRPLLIPFVAPPKAASYAVVEGGAGQRFRQAKLDGGAIASNAIAEVWPAQGCGQRVGVVHHVHGLRRRHPSGTAGFSTRAARAGDSRISRSRFDI